MDKLLCFKGATKRPNFGIKSLVMWNRLLAVLFCCLLVSGCITRPVEVTNTVKLSQVTAGNLPAAPGAITVEIDAHEDLNWFETSSNGLTLAFIQASSRQIISELAKSSFGLQKVLEGTIADPAIVQTDIFLIQPGTQLTVPVARAEMGKYFVIVAGYYNLDPAKSMLVFDTSIYLDRTYHLDPFALFHTDTPMYAPNELIHLQLDQIEINKDETTSTIFWLEEKGLLGRFFYRTPPF